jgi:hypothetical protein
VNNSFWKLAFNIRNWCSKKNFLLLLPHPLLLDKKKKKKPQYFYRNVPTLITLTSFYLFLIILVDKSDNDKHRQKNKS